METVEQSTNAGPRKKKRAPRTYDVLVPGTVKMCLHDKLEHTLRMRNADSNAHIPGQAIPLLKAQVVHAARSLRVEGIPCPKCGVRKITASGVSPIVMRPGHFPHKPTSFSCEVCRATVGPISGLISACSEDWKAELELLRKLGATTPQERQWTIARSGDAGSMQTTTRAGIDAVLPPNHDQTVELCKVVGHDEHAALALVQDAKLPMVKVRLDQHGRPLEHWHALKPTLEEASELDRLRREKRRELEAQIDNELRQERARRLAAAGFLRVGQSRKQRAPDPENP